MCLPRSSLPRARAGSPLRERPSSWLLSEGAQAEAHSFSVPTALQLEFPRKYAVLCVHSGAREDARCSLVQRVMAAHYPLHMLIRDLRAGSKEEECKMGPFS